MPIISGGSSAGGAISGVTVTGTAAAGQVPVASSASAGTWSYPPGHEIGYDPITAPVTVSSTTEATPTTVIACAQHTFDGGAVLLQVFANYWNGPAAGNIRLVLFESTTEITRLAFNGLGQVQLAAAYRFTPSAGAHTYTIGAFVSGTTGVVNAGAGGATADNPAFARFTKV